ncbi:MAG: Adenine-specific DNA methylase containing a Zn-ribbon [Candidatus Carbobacillus altaicus]|uniref:Adenine-specific DNA methylase containing a Zn-ribbon n=1 Tax=Candidatus Carbonibacillus altaicus TaxID=2163959 RepID=A0A2R6Y0B2_9BACL|nr:MAG: Adenine-specific DNA methylase containing a Zn-ribbon [Candidatus Carbobacillus altaicus]
MTTPYTKKLIEVALPLSEINDASAYDKMPGIGPHPKGIHHWWARLPLPVARAVLFASVVDDPSSHPDRFPTEEAQAQERERLFGIIRKMMQKNLHKHPEVYAEARAEMLKHADGKLPPVLDPFAGGGSIPLEAARLGFEAYAGDINPVAVLLNKCNLEIAPRWANHPPVNPEDRDHHKIGGTGGWRGTAGLAADVRYYGRVILERARERIGHLYPPVKITPEMAAEHPHLNPYVGQELPVIAWIWARTVPSPNPAARGAHVPLMSTFWLSSKRGKEAWLEPVVDRAAGTWRFVVRTGSPEDRAAVKAGMKTGRATFRCLLTGDTIKDDYIKGQGKAGQMGVRLVAIVADTGRGRVYLPATEEHEAIAQRARPEWKPEGSVPERLTGGTCAPYGLAQWGDLFTPRQLTAMVTLSDLVREVRADLWRDALAAGFSDAEAEEYARAVTTFLALALDRCADFNNSLCRWSPSNQKVMNLFGRQAIPMVWDFAEANLLGESVGAWVTCSEYVAECIETMATLLQGRARPIDAARPWDGLKDVLVSTDPPYYDNIGYAALSDFFYVWLRRTIGDLYPDLFATILVPKEPELVAAPERFGGDKHAAKEHFEQGLRRAFAQLREKMDPRFPLTVYYAYKQEDEGSGEDEKELNGNDGNRVDRTTGWETMLQALIETGFQITATWPVRASQKWRMVSMGTNALASYIVLACRPRSEDAPQTDRRGFVAELKRELPGALRRLQQGNIAPVDFAQAAIGPGMAIFSRYGRVLEPDGRPMSVRTALGLINQMLTEVLSEQEDEFDNETRWAITWFEQLGFGEGEFGEAELLSKAKVTTVGSLVEAGIVDSKGGKVRLLPPDKLPKDWHPEREARPTVWGAVHHLIRIYYHEKAGEEATAKVVRALGARAELARDLAYRLYGICERRGWTQEAQAYNALVLGWPGIIHLAGTSFERPGTQGTMF